MNRVEEGTKYWHNIDLLKGVLIICVFVGHIAPRSLEDNFIRYFIYAFHMPLFIGISGFLFKVESLEQGVFGLVKKYWHRVIRPWIVATFLFYVINIIRGGQTLSLNSFVYAYVHPWYHLWYIQGYLCYIFIMFVFWKLYKKSVNKWKYIFILSFIISFLSKFKVLENLVTTGVLRTIIDLIQYDFRLYNFIFFILGIYLRVQIDKGQILSWKKVKRYEKLFVLFAAVVIFNYKYANEMLKNIVFFLSNWCGLIVIIYLSINRKFLRNRFLEFLGKYSLPIYLYHIIAIIWSSIFFEKGTTIYYVNNCIIFLFLVVMIYFLRKIDIANKYVFGSIRSN